MTSPIAPPATSPDEKRNNLIKIIYRHFKDPSGQEVLQHRPGALHLLAEACLIARGYKVETRTQTQWNRDPTGIPKLDISTTKHQVSITHFAQKIQLITQELDVVHTVMTLKNTTHDADTKRWDLRAFDFVRDKAYWPDVQRSEASVDDVLAMYWYPKKFDEFVGAFEERLMGPVLCVDKVVGLYSEERCEQAEGKGSFELGEKK